MDLLIGKTYQLKQSSQYTANILAIDQARDAVYAVSHMGIHFSLSISGFSFYYKLLLDLPTLPTTHLPEWF